MKLLKRLLMILIGLILLLLVVGFFLPAEFGLSRSIVIDAPQEVVFDQIANLRNNEAWSPWKEADATLVTTYPGAVEGVGASYSWTGEASGSGTYTISQTEPPRYLAFDMLFEGATAAAGDWTLSETAGGTEVVWTFQGNAGSNPIGRYMGLMIDSFLGPQYERGLENLKRVAEAVPPPAPEPESMEATDSDAEAAEEGDGEASDS